jgi:hypothetical protein
MQNNISNFFNLVKGGRVKKTLAPNDMIAIGVRNPVTQSDFQPAAIFFKDLEAQIGGGVTLTTTGTSGVSTLTGTVLNIPNYTSTGVASVTGLDTDNTDPLNPIVQISVDGTTITGDGTPGNPLIGSGGSLPPWVETNATDLTLWTNGQGNIITNTSYGDEALKINTTGSVNTAIGYRTLTSNTTGAKNVALGNNALFTNDSGISNVAIGYNTMYFNISGRENLGIGNSSLVFNTTANYNTALGAFSLRDNITGSQNTGIGSEALYTNTIGVNNTSVGFQSLRINTTGSSNTALGYDTQSGNFSGSVILGSSAAATANNQFVVGSVGVNAGAIATEALVPTKSWTVKINGVDYKIPLQIA